MPWSTVRFTGKEIIQDAPGCARQAHAIAMKLQIDAGPGLAKTAAHDEQLVLGVGSGASSSRRR
jgi:hypothetical protein